MPSEAAETETQTEEEPQTPDPPTQTQVAPQQQRRTTQLLSEQTLGQIKKHAREKGKHDAMAALEQEAKSAGFSSYAEMKAFAAERKKQPAQTQPQRPQTQGQPGSNGSGGVSRREYERLQQENATLNERVKTLQKENTRLARRQREDAREHAVAVANLELKFDALKAGVKPKLIPAAIALFREQIPQRNDGESEQAYLDRLKKYDQEKAFASLRETEPMLFVSSETPAPPPAKPPAGNGSVVPQNKAPGAKAPVVAAPQQSEQPGGPSQGNSSDKGTDNKAMIARLKELGIENGDELLNQN